MSPSLTFSGDGVGVALEGVAVAAAARGDADPDLVHLDEDLSGGRDEPALTGCAVLDVGAATEAGRAAEHPMRRIRPAVTVLDNAQGDRPWVARRSGCRVRRWRGRSPSIRVRAASARPGSGRSASICSTESDFSPPEADVVPINGQPSAAFAAPLPPPLLNMNAPQGSPVWLPVLASTG